jgi:uncharacterized repeat protein (TIGR01451 family)
MPSIRIVFAVIGIFLTTVAAARAQGEIKLTPAAYVEKEIIDKDGKKQIRKASVENVTPGTEVVFTTCYQNISNYTVQDTVITNPIPKEVIFQEGSARGDGADITYSIDGGKTYDMPVNLFVLDRSGRKFAARPQDYTHIRWTVSRSLPSGAKGEVSFRAILK